MFQPKQTIRVELPNDFGRNLKQKSEYFKKQTDENTEVSLLKAALYHASGFLDGIALAFEMQAVTNPINIQRNGGDNE